MKTAISIDDELLREADQTAKQIGTTRSGLFARAISEFLNRQRQESMLQKLNDVYAERPDPGEKHLLKRMKAKFRPAAQDRW